MSLTRSWVIRIAAAVAVAASGAFLSPRADASEPCSEVRRVVEGFYEAYRRLDVPAMLSFYADDAVLIDPVLGLNLVGKAQIAEAAADYSNFDSVEGIDVRTYCEEDRVVGIGVGRLHYHGQPVTVPFAMLFRVRDGLIVEERDYVAYRDISRVDRERRRARQ